MPEADDGERPRGGELPTRLVAHPALERLRQRDGVADRRLQPVPAVAAEHRPELERAEPAPESGPVLAEADDLVRCAEVLGDDAERVAQLVRPPCPEGGAALRREQPLVRVDDERVGTLDPLERPAVLGADHRGAGVGRVDVQPDAVLLARVSNRRDGVDRGGRRGADRRDHRARVGQVERVGPEPERLVGRCLPHLEPQEPARLLDGRVRMLRADDDGVVGPCLARRSQPGDRRDRRAVLELAVPAGREAQQLREPRERHLLELLERRGGPPEDPDVVEPGHEELGEDRRLRGARREVGEEPRALPVRQPGQEDVVEVAQQVRERLAVLGRVLRQPRADLARLDLRQHGQLPDPLEVALDPLQRREAVPRERVPLLLSHVPAPSNACAPEHACSRRAASILGDSNTECQSSNFQDGSFEPRARQEHAERDQPGGGDRRRHRERDVRTRRARP